MEGRGWRSEPDPAEARGYLNKENFLCYDATTVQAGKPMTVKEMIGGASAPPVTERMAMARTPSVIEVTAGEIAAELKRRGISSDERVTLTIEPERELIPGRRESRTRVVAAGLSDADIDRLIKQAQHEVEPPRLA